MTFQNKYTSKPHMIYNFILLWSENILCIVSILLNLLRLVLWPKDGLSCIMFHVPLRRMCILLSLGGVLYKYLLGLAYIVIESFICLLVLYLLVLSLIDGRVFKSPTIIVKLSISLFNSVSFCFMYFGFCCQVHVYLQLLYLDKLTF